ncbi:MAG: tetratricopeptide repeat protein [Bacteroidetes bacterium]|nr:tetratricopeptide repeat protein [Bacteroidota bacterium]
MKREMKIAFGLLILTVLITGCLRKEYPRKTKIDEKTVKIEETDTEYKYFFAEGIKQKMLGNIGQAARYFEKAMKLNKKSSAACYELSSIYTITGNYNEAIKYARRAEKLDEKNIWYKLHLANLYHITKEVDSTIVIYEKIQNKFPDRNDLAFNLSELYKEKGEKEKALRIYEKLEERIGISKHLGLAKEDIYEKEGKFELAKNELDKLLRVYENDVNIMGVLAELYHNNGYDDKAKETYEKIFKIEPDNYNAKVSLLGYYRKKKEYTKVFEIVREIIENSEIKVNEKVQMMLSFISNPVEIRNYTANIEIFVRKLEDQYPDDHKVKAIAADLCIRTGKLEEARNKLKYIIEKGKGNFVLWEQFLLIENSMRNYSELYKGSERAIKIYPESPIFYLLKGISASELKKYEVSIKALEEGLKFVKNDNQLKIQFYSIIGDSYKSMGLQKKSDEAMEMALEIDSENTIVLNNYAYYLSERGCRLRKALKMSGKCIIIEPKNATYLDTYGWILYKMGKINEAKAYLEKAMNNAGVNDPEITEHYGDILYEMKEYVRAVETWEDAILLGGEKKKIEKKINEAKQENSEKKK